MNSCKILFLMLLLISCRGNQKSIKIDKKKATTIWKTKGIIGYPVDTVISTSNGVPKSKLTLYFPNYTFPDTIKYFTFLSPQDQSWKIIPRQGSELDKKMIASTYNVQLDQINDSFSIQENSRRLVNYSNNLYKFDEPVLSNFYLNKDIIRLRFSGSLVAPPFIICILKKNDSITLVYKQARPGEYTSGNFSFATSQKKLRQIDYRSLDSTINAVRLDTFSYWRGNPGTDGGSYLLEVHSKNGYYFVDIPNLEDNYYLKNVVLTILKLQRV